MSIFKKNNSQKKSVVIEKVTQQELPIGDTRNSIELLKLEFDYAKSTSIECQRDRMTLVNFYLALYAGIGTLTLGASEVINGKFAKYIPFSFIILGLISYIFVLQMVRLRQAWFEAAKVMNRIKDYFIEKDASLDKYIIWRNATLPKPEKFKTVNYLSTLLLSILGALAIVLGLVLFNIPLAAVLIVGVAYFFFSTLSYYYMLKYWK